ncbi:1095_t:CDS:1, partial [Gigaspora rosea]
VYNGKRSFRLQARNIKEDKEKLRRIHFEDNQNIGSKIKQDVKIKKENKGDNLALRRYCLNDRLLEKANIKINNHKRIRKTHVTQTEEE